MSEADGGAIAFVPFCPSDLGGLRLQGAEAYLQPVVEGGAGHHLAVPGLAWSGMIDGRVVGCAGVWPIWEGRASTWALFGEIPKPQWLRLHRHVLRVLERAHGLGYWRIEAAVDAGFAPGRRWVSALGFVNETPEAMAGYGPTGRDFLLYARIDVARLAASRVEGAAA